jgi:heme a synthase
MSPSAGLALLALGTLVALAALGWWWRGQRHQDGAARYRALVWLTAFLTLDLVVFGAFTRLTDSGLGCPDWPGCYGSASPWGADVQIDAAQRAMPTGPVTWSKAWIEMLHRYFAMGIGALMLVMAVWSWIAALRKHRWATPMWASVGLVWVVVQGMFGKLTVTWKLYPAIVTLHLLGGLGLLMLLAAQSQLHARGRWHLPGRWRAAVLAMLLLTLLQVSLGGWVSANYAVLACTDFPTCQGQLWPAMDFVQGFSLQRSLGLAPDGAPLSFAALTAIHVAHRLGAAALSLGLLILIAALYRQRSEPAQRWAGALLAALVWQLLSGLSNVVLGWPLLAALAHTLGAAVLLVLLTVLWMRSADTP